MKTVAVTGGIGSGKSTVCSMLASRGIPVYDSDSAAKRLYLADRTLLDDIEEAFGCGIRQSDGTLDKAKLSSIVFSAPEKLKTLNGIVHPAVLRDFKRWNAMQSSRLEGKSEPGMFWGKEPFCVLESAIILDCPEFGPVISRTVLVDAPLNVRLKRACERDCASRDEIIRRMAAQHFDVSKVDAIIRNDGTFAQLVKAAAEVFRKLKL